MKNIVVTKLPSLPTCGIALLTLVASSLLLPQPAAAVEARPVAKTIPWNQIGTKATAEYQGNGLTVTPAGNGARLRCVFQRLEAEATSAGLWLTSTVNDSTKDRFRVLATAIGRTDTYENSKANRVQSGGASFCTAERQLPNAGSVTTDGPIVKFTRPGLIEEYSVSMDGVRQDFVVLERPFPVNPITAGAGELRLDLAVSGATAQRTPTGVQLVLTASGRKIAYNRLRVTDATGKELPARMEVRSPIPQEASDSSSSLALLVNDTEAAYPIRIDPTFSDANWISLGALPGTDAQVNAVAVDDNGDLYIGGSFQIVGNVIANGIAKWDGVTWHSLGGGVGGSEPVVWTLLLVNGDLYVGGEFTTVSDNQGTPITVNRIAKWDGVTWHSLGAGVNSDVYDYPAVYALAMLNDDLYVGGGFSSAGGVAANHIAKWSGNSWSALNAEVDDGVASFAVIGNDLYAGGWFTTAGAVEANYIAKWNGSSWSTLGEGLSDAVIALTASGTTLYAGGYFQMAGETEVNYVAAWDGNDWASLGTGTDDVVQALAVSGDDLYVGGDFRAADGQEANRIAKWDGTTWSPLDTGANYSVYALALSESEVYAGGDFTSMGGNAANHLARWNGAAWSSLNLGVNHPVNALAVLGDQVFIGDVFSENAASRHANTNVAQRIIGWDTGNWQKLGSGLAYEVDYPSVYALAVAGDSLYVGGEFSMAGGAPAANIAKWNGTSWSALGTGLNGRVYSLLADGDELYAGGDFWKAGELEVNYIARWDGHSWNALGTGMDDRVRAMVTLGGNLYAGGEFWTAGGVTVQYIAQWDGTNWSAMASGTGAPVRALAVFKSDLIVGGTFSEASGVAANHIAKWSGGNWSQLGAGMNDWGNALAASGRDLFAGGDFTEAGDSSANHLAHWDGNNWNSVGSGVGGLQNPTVNALVLAGTNLYVGGEFMIAGGAASPFVAAVTVPTVAAPIPLHWELNGSVLTLSWDDPAFRLQSAPEASGVYTNLPGAGSPYTINPTEPRRFFRLNAP